ncbi:Ribosomal protein S12, mitochondrial, partial [Cucurbita argyrosperma subsp. argyrosperma]
MLTLSQLIRHGREEKRLTDSTRASNQCPKKPNSTPRKIAKVRLSNRHDIFTHILGEGHNLQEHSMVLTRGGRVKDLPGVKSHFILGVMDLLGISDRRRGRSKIWYSLTCIPIHCKKNLIDNELQDAFLP